MLLILEGLLIFLTLLVELGSLVRLGHLVFLGVLAFLGFWVVRLLIESIFFKLVRVLLNFVIIHLDALVLTK
jgi:hypothetical protein